MISIDIETIPNKAMIDHLPEPEVALGNTKDPVKIREKYAAAKVEQIEKMALNPFFGRVCSVATWGEYEGYETIDEISDAAEIQLLNHLFERLQFSDTTAPLIITWNGMSFDMPFLYKRAALLRIVLPSNCPGLSYWTKKYSHTPHCDLERILSNWESQRIKLDHAAKMFLGEQKLEHDFTKFIELIETGESSEIGIYNLKDAEITFKLYEFLRPYLF